MNKEPVVTTAGQVSNNEVKAVQICEIRGSCRIDYLPLTIDYFFVPFVVKVEPC